MNKNSNKDNKTREEKIKKLASLITGNPLVPEDEKALFNRHKEFISDDELDYLLDVFKDFNKKVKFAFKNAVMENPEALEEFKKKRKEVDAKFKKTREEKHLEETAGSAEESLEALNETENE